MYHTDTIIRALIKGKPEVRAKRTTILRTGIEVPQGAIGYLLSPPPRGGLYALVFWQDAFGKDDEWGVGSFDPRGFEVTGGHG